MDDIDVLAALLPPLIYGAVIALVVLLIVEIVQAAG